MQSDNDTQTEFSDSSITSDSCSETKFMHMPVDFKTMKVAAILDSGSSISVMSVAFYNMLPKMCKSPIQQCD